MGGYFVDWLTVYQVHPAGGLPILGDDLVCTYDIETGELKKQVIKGYQHEGSFDTRLRVRCDGSRVEVSGNPSVFGRPDNLYGVHSVRAGVEVFNGLLASLGLPEFSEDEVTRLAPRQWARSDGVMKSESCVITRVDVTKNLRVGDVRLAIRTLSGYVHRGKAGHLYPDGCTVAWSGQGAKLGSPHQMVKYYDKSVLLRARAKELRRQRIEEGSDDWESRECHVQYLERLAEWCEKEGLLRYEVSLKWKRLNKLGLQRLGSWDGLDMGTVIESSKFHKRLNVEAGDPGSIFQELVNQGVKSHRARALENSYRAWLSGADLRVGVSLRTFYRVRKDLLAVGVDVGSVADVSRLPLRQVRVGFQDIAPPSWYVMPGEAANAETLRAA